MELTDELSQKINNASSLNEKLRTQSSSLLKTIVESSFLSMSLLEAVRDEHNQICDFLIILVNREYVRATGRNDLVGKLYAQEYPGVIKSGVFDIMLQVMQTGQTQQIEYYYPYDGFNKWFSCMFVKVDDGLVATTLDISERKKAEEQNLRNLTLLQKSEQLSKTGSWEYNVKTKAFTWSEGMYRLFELDNKTEISPEIYLQYSDPKNVITAHKIVKYITEGVSNFESKLTIQLKDKAKTLKLSSTVFHDEFDMPDKVIGFDMDITALELAKQQIKYDTSFIRGVADAAPDMLYVIDLNNKQMIYANNNVMQLFRKSAAEIRKLGPKLFDMFVYAKDKKKFDNSLEELKTVMDEEVKELTYRLYDAHGKIHWISTRRSVLKRDKIGKATHVIGVSQDVTMEVALNERNRQLVAEREEIEKKQRHEIFRVTLSTQEEERKRIAESLHNGLGQLLYGVKLSLEQLSANGVINTAENIEAMKQTSQLLNEAIADARKISHELMPTVLEHFGLRLAIEDVCRKATLNTHVELSCKIVGFPEKLDKHYELAVYRMMQELILNIVKHANATRAIIKTRISDKSIHISAKDNGKGFKPADYTVKGIGLKSLQSKVKLLNGKIQITSEPGNGTMIKIQIPNELV